MLKAQFVSAKNDYLVVGAGVGGDGWQLLARGRHLQVGGLIHIGSAWRRVKGRNKSRELPCDDMIVIPVFQLPEHVPHFDIVRTQTPFIIRGRHQSPSSLQFDLKLSEDCIILIGVFTTLALRG